MLGTPVTSCRSVVLTVFAVPKPFSGHIGVIQRNAVRSWKRLHPECRVILCGDEAGCGDVVSELDVDWIPDVETNEFGTPLLSSVFARVEKQAAHDLLCYANADLVLFPDLLDPVRVVTAEYERFLIVGEAVDLEVTREIAFEGAETEDLREQARKTGALRGRKAIDFFVFPRGTVGTLPAFVVGRPGWDNWMIWHARSTRLPVVDVTGSTTVVHQSHGYGHVQLARGPRWYGPEGDRNFAILGWEERRFTLDDVTHRATRAGLSQNHTGVKRRIRTELILHDRTVRLARVLERGNRLLRIASRRLGGRVLGPSGL